MTRTEEDIQWTILSLIRWSERHLNEHGIDSPRLSAELILAEALRRDRVYLYTHFDQPLLRNELDTYKKMFRRRLSHEPLQYILGRTDFFGRTFSVDPRVLIPRPETELLAEWLLDEVRKKSGQPEVTVADLGTGSGILAVTLSLADERIRCIAIDKSPDALDVARENAQRYGVDDRIRFEESDMLAENLPLPSNGIDFIVSNPPYIPANEWSALPEHIRTYEPKEALTDDGDGFAFYRSFTSIASGVLKPGGGMLVEVGAGQSDTVMRMFENTGARTVQTRNDYAGITRLVGGFW